jgi:GTPase
LVGVDTQGASTNIQGSLEELARLAETAGAEVVGSVTQKLAHPMSGTYVGKGKLEEIKELRDPLEYDLVIFNDELSPAQQRNLEKTLDIKIVDRTALILDVFARRAQTHEGRMQVELAQLEYRLPRLTGMWTHLSRQAVGGVGLRGPGETQLESDRRELGKRIAFIKRELTEVHRHRELYREHRRERQTPVIALVGYTNAGKSTLLNALSGSDVLAEDKLFATLDPLTRRVMLPGGQEVLLSDTVGFIAKLPTGLVAAFRATLEELDAADLLLHVVDVSSARATERAEVVQGVLDELGVGERPALMALNKADLLAGSAEELERRLPEARLADSVVVSARQGWNVGELLERIETMLERGFLRVRVRIPYDQAALVDLFHRKGSVATERHTENGTLITGSLPARFAAPFRRYAVR